MKVGNVINLDLVKTSLYTVYDVYNRGYTPWPFTRATTQTHRLKSQAFIDLGVRARPYLFLNPSCGDRLEFLPKKTISKLFELNFSVYTYLKM